MKQVVLPDGTWSFVSDEDMAQVWEVTREDVERFMETGEQPTSGLLVLKIGESRLEVRSEALPVFPLGKFGPKA